MLYYIVLFLIISFVITAASVFPLSAEPQYWYEFPLIPGLENKARIIFYHVPAAWISVIAFFMSMYYGIKYLKDGKLQDDLKSESALQLGLIFCIMAAVTGSIWAKFSWGEFWHWDPRETSIFILMLIYGALLVLRAAVDDLEKRGRLSAVYSIIAFLTVPFFVFIMPRIMIGLHPGSADDTTTGPVVDFKMNWNMQAVFYLALTGFTLLYYKMWNLNYRINLLKYQKGIE